jgi:glutamate/tyrosine decarboxylase-like PLP-dependent enzyme
VVPKGINHHSIRSTIESIGFGAANVVEVPTQKDSFQVDYDLLEETLGQLNQDGKIIIGYLDVIGSTGFGSMTNTRKILEIRENCEKKNFSFNIHIDGAYGGPLVAMFRNSDGSMMSLEEAKEKYVTAERGFSTELLSEMYETFSHLGEVDSVTIDLHKSIFGVYSGGGGSILWKNKAVKEIISKFPPYYGDRENGEPYAFSRLEGCTFPGSAATAAYLSIQNVGLDSVGIGRYHAESIKSCSRIFDCLNGLEMLGRKWGDVSGGNSESTPDTYF